MIVVRYLDFVMEQDVEDAKIGVRRILYVVVDIDVTIMNLVVDVLENQISVDYFNFYINILLVVGDVYWFIMGNLIWQRGFIVILSNIKEDLTFKHILLIYILWHDYVR